MAFNRCTISYVYVGQSWMRSESGWDAAHVYVTHMYIGVVVISAQYILYSGEYKSDYIAFN